MIKHTKWFLEAFTKKYYKKNPVVSVFYYVFSFFVIYSFITNKIYLLNIEGYLLFFFKIIILIFILYVLKIILEKEKILVMVI
jgi:hypothetical protein